MLVSYGHVLDGSILLAIIFELIVPSVHMKFTVHSEFGYAKFAVNKVVPGVVAVSIPKFILTQFDPVKLFIVNDALLHH